ncbi:MAG TPA: amino acid adenylation domain-containing protein, partial [Chloroflexota bacterium]|nr:amino acid adenylation domain-containing protein [Chloroflexota bacterium]
VSALQVSLDEVVRRHEVLRTTFVAHEGRPAPVVAEHLSVALPVVDLRAVPEPEREETARRMMEVEARAPFDLARGPLLRAHVWRLGREEHIVLCTMHHIVADAWSIGVLLRELATLYESRAMGRHDQLPELPIQYADYASWQRQRLHGQLLAAQLAYWQRHLADPLPVLQLPTDRPRLAASEASGATHPLVVSPATAEALARLGRQEGATLFMITLAAFATLLFRYSGQDDIVVGAPIANRIVPEVEELIGFFANTLALRIDLSGNPTFRELLGRVREVALGAYAHQDLPFERLVEELGPERHLDRQPLFQVALAWQPAAETVATLSGLTLSSVALDTGTAKFDLTLSLRETTQGLAGHLEYRTDLFDPATIGRLVDHLQILLAGVADNPDAHLDEAPLLPEAERRRVLVEWNDTRTAYPRDAAIHQLFQEQAAATPGAVAVVFSDTSMTYDELDRRATALARHLRELGVGPEVCVGICVERSSWMIVGLLGILKAGGAYVPLDPAYPTARLAFMVVDAGVRVIVTEQQHRETLAACGATLVCPETYPPLPAAEDRVPAVADMHAGNLAYVTYTSGSTGAPKGVCVTHRNVVRLVKNTTYVRLGPEEVFLQLAPLAFDASTFEIWAPLLNGSRLVVFPPRAPSLAELGEVLRAQRITTLWLTAGLFQQMVAEQLDGLRGIRQLLAGGDVLPAAHVQRVLEACEGLTLINGYGPTETTTFACCHRMTEPRPGMRSVPIGRPIANTRTYLLDGRRQPVPIGVPGELYIGGDGVAQGYLNQPELTRERFLADPFSAEPGARMYRSGDQARYLADGSIEYLGRLDSQVKLRGFRVEPGEIESVLTRHHAVTEAVVIATDHASGDRRLVAYVVPRGDEAPAIADLRRFLQELLPAYMVPATFVPLAALPLTANGKLDRGALPAQDVGTFAGDVSSYAAPTTPLEATLADLWAAALGVERVGLHDDFFALGGHSLLATELIARVRRACGVELPLRSLFEAPTVHGLALVISRLRAEGGEAGSVAALPAIVPAPHDLALPFPLTDVQQAYWLGRSSAFELGNVGTHL